MYLLNCLRLNFLSPYIIYSACALFGVFTVSLELEFVGLSSAIHYNNFIISYSYIHAWERAGLCSVVPYYIEYANTLQHCTLLLMFSRARLSHRYKFTYMILNKILSIYYRTIIYRTGGVFALQSITRCDKYLYKNKIKL